MLDMSRIGPVLTGEDPALADGPPVTAMLVQNTNPALIAPDIGKVHAGFKRDDLFLCVHEQFMTDTAKFADIVLPATMFLEHDDIYSSGGHGHFHFAPKAIDGPEGCVSNHDLLCQLAKRLGASHRGFDMTALEIIDETLITSGLGGIAAIEEARWIDLQADFETSHFMNGFPTDNGRFKFKVDWAAHGPYHAGLSALPDYSPKDIDAASAEHPFRLVVPPARNYLNSSFTETPTSIKREAKPVVKMHPDVARAKGIDDGDLVTLGNQLGSVGVHAEIFADLQPEVLIVEGVWPNAAFPGGLGINVLISAAPSRPASGGVFHDTAVWLKKGFTA
jgi:anaerobic selenocysteine-containing dehydrogenase